MEKPWLTRQVKVSLSFSRLFAKLYKQFKKKEKKGPPPPQKKKGKKRRKKKAKIFTNLIALSVSDLTADYRLSEIVIRHYLI